MRLIEAHARLLAWSEPAFRTDVAAARLATSPAHASQILARLAKTGHALRLAHGLWGLPGRMDRLALPSYLTAPFPSYVSLQSALYHHGMIDQIPATTYAVSLARARRYETPLGPVSVHHLPPALFFGFADAGPPQARLASPEKALVDLLYLGPAKSGLFRSWPEIEPAEGFSAGLARRMASRIPSPRRRAMVARRLETLLLEIGR